MAGLRRNSGDVVGLETIDCRRLLETLDHSRRSHLSTVRVEALEEGAPAKPSEGELEDSVELNGDEDGRRHLYSAGR
jgi:hypothetical protein